MWFKEYKDYPIDAPLKKETLSPGRNERGNGFNGVEMKEPNGWGHQFDLPVKNKKEGFLRKILKRFF